MGTMIFEGDPPYDTLYAISVKSQPTLEGIELTLTVGLEGPGDDSVPVRILLEPVDASALGGLLPIQADIVQRWRENQG